MPSTSSFDKTKRLDDIEGGIEIQRTVFMNEDIYGTGGETFPIERLQTNARKKRFFAQRHEIHSSSM